VLHQLEVIDHFITDIETLSLPVMLVIPGVVINELDGCVGMQTLFFLMLTNIL
jgi:hypothetical protein